VRIAVVIVGRPLPRSYGRYYDAAVRCKVSYKSPDGEELSEVLKSEIAVGRDADRSDIVLTPLDNSISGVAVMIERDEDRVVLTNTSSFAQLDVLHEQGTRFLFPNEKLTVTSSVSISIPGSIFTHTVEVEVEGATEVSTSPSTTTPLQPEHFEVPEERKDTLILLCAPRFYPERFGSALLSAADIAKIITRSGEAVTAKAINNKLQRLRNDIAEKLHVYLDSREDLADWAIRNGHVTRSDVDTLLGE